MIKIKKKYYFYFLSSVKFLLKSYNRIKLINFFKKKLKNTMKITTNNISPKLNNLEILKKHFLR
jgi:hypothetical protein